jgi:hypothetical protein
MTSFGARFEDRLAIAAATKESRNVEKKDSVFYSCHTTKDCITINWKPTFV